VLIPRDKEIISRFMESVAQFERIVNDSDFIKLERLSEEDIIGTTSKQGLLEQYLVFQERGNTMQDIALGGEEVRIGNKGFVCIRPIPMICLGISRNPL
jgi:hypothetical protein